MKIKKTIAVMLATVSIIGAMPVSAFADTSITCSYDQICNNQGPSKYEKTTYNNGTSSTLRKIGCCL